MMESLSLAWEEHCSSHSGSWLLLWETQALLIFLYYGIGGAFFVLDILHLPAFLYATKLQKNRQFAPGGSRTNPSAGALFTTLAIGHVLVLLPMNVLLWILSEARWGGTGVRLSCAELPGLGELLGGLVGMAVLEEVVFYYSHRALHWGVLYKRIHKKHHEFIAPIALAANYAHPLEILVSNALPLMAGPILLSAHLLTTWLWFSIAIVGTLVHHCGFRFPWHPSIDHQPDFHDRHHMLFKCNYGLLGVLDYLHGTYVH